MNFFLSMKNKILETIVWIKQKYKNGTKNSYKTLNTNVLKPVNTLNVKNKLATKLLDQLKWTVIGKLHLFWFTYV